MQLELSDIHSSPDCRWYQTRFVEASSVIRLDLRLGLPKGAVLVFESCLNPFLIMGLPKGWDQLELERLLRRRTHFSLSRV